MDIKDHKRYKALWDNTLILYRLYSYHNILYSQHSDNRKNWRSIWSIENIAKVWTTTPCLVFQHGLNLPCTLHCPTLASRPMRPCTTEEWPKAAAHIRAVWCSVSNWFTCHGCHGGHASAGHLARSWKWTRDCSLESEPVDTCRAQQLGSGFIYQPATWGRLLENEYTLSFAHVLM